MAGVPENRSSDEPKRADDDPILDHGALDDLLRAAAEEAPGKTGRAEGDLDALIQGGDLDRPLTQGELDGVLGADETEEAGFDTVAARSRAEEADAPGDLEPLSQAMIDAFAQAAAQHEEALAPKARTRERPPVDDDVLTQEELDSIKQSGPPGESAAKAQTPDAEPETVDAGPGRRYSLFQILATFAVGVVAAFGTFTFLFVHRTQAPDLSTLDALYAPNAPDSQSVPPESDRAAPQGPTSAEPGVFPEASPAGPDASESEVARIAASIKALKPKSKPSDVEAIQDAINDFIGRNPKHARAASVLTWKADLYRREHKPELAREVYKRIFLNYGSSADLDQTLLSAARTALSAGQPNDALKYVEQLSTQFPDSPLRKDAELATADAYAATDRGADAQAIYQRMADAEPESSFGAAALVGLAGIAVDAGHFDAAIGGLERRLAIKGLDEDKDEAHWLLARAYRGANRGADAEQEINVLLTEFPRSARVPAAWVELSGVLNDLGRRPEALQTARKAAAQAPDNLDLRRNVADLLILDGGYREAADALMGAPGVTTTDPDLLLDAARYLRKADALPEAERAYERMVAVCPKSAKTFQAEIELAEVLLQQGNASLAVQHLERLRRSGGAGPVRLTALQTLADAYGRLGCKPQAAQVAQEIATLSTEPEVLAQAAIAMLDGGETEKGMALARRVDVAQLSDQSAYALLMKQGERLAGADEAGKGLELLVRAYDSYPEERGKDLEQRLVQAYLAKDDPTRAKALADDIERIVQTNAAEAPRLRWAAIALADYWFGKQDYKAAAAEYARAIAADDGKSTEGVWARYQRANALFEIRNFDDSIRLYDEVAASTVPWAKEARIKAEHGRVEQRLRGLPATAAPAASTKRG